MVSTPSDKLVTVFGGSGFIGRQIVRSLAKRGYRIRVACRRPDLAGHVLPLGTPGQIALVQANLRYPASVAAACEGAYAVINATGTDVSIGRAVLRRRGRVRLRGRCQGRQAGQGQR